MAAVLSVTRAVPAARKGSCLSVPLSLTNTALHGCDHGEGAATLPRHLTDKNGPFRTLAPCYISGIAQMAHPVLSPKRQDARTAALLCSSQPRLVRNLRLPPPAGRTFHLTATGPPPAPLHEAARRPALAAPGAARVCVHFRCQATIYFKF